jgi:diguanylate cyclase (GGDEF)-like protein
LNLDEHGERDDVARGDPRPEENCGEMHSMHPHPNTRDIVGSGAITAGLAALGGAVAPLAALPIGAASVLCGLPFAAAAAVADRQRGIAATIGLAIAGLAGLWLDGASPAAIASSVFVIASATATLTIATTRRRRHERAVVGLQRLNHQILGDATRRPDYHVETCADVRVSHETALLALHEFSRRVATHVSLETLVPTIVATTKAMTPCQHAAVYFWNGRERVLRDALSLRCRDVGSYVPDPTTGAAGWVIATQQVYTAAAADVSLELAKATAGDARRPAGIAPLIAGNELLGLLIADQTDNYAPVSPALLCNIANVAALGLRNARLVEQLADASRRDPLTGLVDRSQMAAAAEQLADRSAGSSPFGIIAGDVDRFESIVKAHGADAADGVLQEIARLWKATMPNDSVTARLDRDAFVAVVPNRDSDELRHLAEGLRNAVAGYPFAEGAIPLSVSMSFGTGRWQRGEQSFHEALGEVLAAVKRSKAAGRNRIEPASEPVAS